MYIFINPNNDWNVDFHSKRWIDKNIDIQVAFSQRLAKSATTSYDIFGAILDPWSKFSNGLDNTVTKFGQVVISRTAKVWT